MTENNKIIEYLFYKYSNNTSLSEGHYECMMDKQDFEEALSEFIIWYNENSAQKE